MQLALQIQTQIRIGDLLLGLLLHLVQDLLRALQELPDAPDVAGVEGEGDHRLHGGQVHYHRAVIAGSLLGLQSAVLLRPAMDAEVFLYLIISPPHGGQAGGFRGHYIDTVSEIHR